MIMEKKCLMFGSAIHARSAYAEYVKLLIIVVTDYCAEAVCRPTGAVNAAGIVDVA